MLQGPRRLRIDAPIYRMVSLEAMGNGIVSAMDPTELSEYFKALGKSGARKRWAKTTDPKERKKATAAATKARWPAGYKPKHKRRRKKAKPS